MDNLQDLQIALQKNFIGQAEEPIDLVTFDNPQIMALGRRGQSVIVVFGKEATRGQRFATIGTIGWDGGISFNGQRTENYEIAVGYIPGDRNADEVMKGILGRLRATTDRPFGLTETEARNAYDFFELGPEKDTDVVQKKLPGHSQ